MNQVNKIMEAKELRVQNLVISPSGKIMTVVEIRKNTLRIRHWSGVTSVIATFECSGIPLTEEILIKAGFEKRPCDWYFKLYSAPVQEQVGEFCVNINSGSCCALEQGEDDISPAWFGYRVQSIHQLQNCWYFLTGEELEIKS